jgi:hypothetical protein
MMVKRLMLTDAKAARRWSPSRTSSVQRRDHVVDTVLMP